MNDQPITLYLDLAKGQTADLEVVARASIAFAGVIREVAFVLDPAAELRIGFASGTEGSLSINSVITSVGDKLKNPATRLAIVLAVATWFGHKAEDFFVHKAFEAVLGGHKLSQGEIDEIAAAVAKAIRNKEAEKNAREVYRQLEADHAVTGVAVTDRPVRPPEDRIVPRQEFIRRSSVEQIAVSEPKKRTTTTKERLTLISPVLLDQTRSWKFWLPSVGPFGARVVDEKFIKSLISGRRKVPMRGGIQMDVVLETHEEYEAGVWVPRQRLVKEVLKVLKVPATGDLFATLSKEADDDGE